MPDSADTPTDAQPDDGSRPVHGSGYHDSGFRGIGAELLRTFPPLTPPRAASAAASAFPTVHGLHLVSPIQEGAWGNRVSSCPVCLADVDLLFEEGGWVTVHCHSCGTEFIASDGSPPPAPPPPPPAPLVLEPPLSALHGEFTAPVPIPMELPRGARPTTDGRWLVLCPHCDRCEVPVPKRFSRGIELHCPECRGAFIVSHDYPPLRSSPPPPRDELPLPPLPPLPPVYEPPVPFEGPKEPITRPTPISARTVGSLIRGTPHWEVIAVLLIAIPLVAVLWFLLPGQILAFLLRRFAALFGV